MANPILIERRITAGDHSDTGILYLEVFHSIRRCAHWLQIADCECWMNLLAIP